MKCPKCRAELVEVAFNHDGAALLVDRCEGCGGLWFDALELEAALRTKGAEKLDSGDPKVGLRQNTNDRIRCPHCQLQMVRLVDPGQPHIWFEQCAGCGGSFFDAGEFRDLKQHTISDWFKRLFAKPRH